MECTLCQSQDLRAVSSQSSQFSCWQCTVCDLIFKDPKEILSFEQQKQRYDQHKNTSEDQGYVQFFERLLGPLGPSLQEFKISRGLDWGSGPKPVLKDLLKNRGVKLDIYDPIYHNHLEILDESYPLITSTEVIEHFSKPRKEFVQIDSLLGSGGIFAGMTQFHQGPEHFSNWWYVRDTTHVSFYSEKTMKWIASFLNYKVLVLSSPVFIFKSKS